MMNVLRKFIRSLIQEAAFDSGNAVQQNLALYSFSSPKKIHVILYNTKGVDDDIEKAIQMSNGSSSLVDKNRPLVIDMISHRHDAKTYHWCFVC